MNQKFGGGRKPTGTPSLAWSCVVVVVVVSLLAGASVVHNIYKPDLVDRVYPTPSSGGNEIKCSLPFLQHKPRSYSGNSTYIGMTIVYAPYAAVFCLLHGSEHFGSNEDLGPPSSKTIMYALWDSRKHWEMEKLPLACCCEKGDMVNA